MNRQVPTGGVHGDQVSCVVDEDVEREKQPSMQPGHRSNVGLVELAAFDW